MKKLKLKELQFAAGEILSRAQLKNVLGGSGSGCPPAGEQWYYEDSEICGIWTTGDAPAGFTECPGTMTITAYQPCGYA